MCQNGIPCIGEETNLGKREEDATGLNIAWGKVMVGDLEAQI